MDDLALNCQHSPKSFPIKTRPGIGLAPRRNVRMADDIPNRKNVLECSYKLSEFFVLDGFERLVVATFKLDANREIVAALASTPA